MTPIVDVNIAVYNQAAYLRQTLDSVLAQKTDFHFRILIGDDCSTDGSVEILKEYESLEPTKIEVIYQPVNIGLNALERNGIILLKKSTAKYISLLDGDDYWTDPFKLQQQVDFLEKNIQYAGCFHNTEERYDEDDIRASHLYCDYPYARNVSFNDLSYSNRIPTCSVVYRRGLFGEFPEWYPKLKMGDWPLHLLNAQYGDFWYMPKIMAVHRLHNDSSWMLQDEKENNKHTIEAYDIMIKGFAHNPDLQQQLILARQVYLYPPKPAFKRRMINFLKRLSK